MELQIPWVWTRENFAQVSLYPIVSYQHTTKVGSSLCVQYYGVPLREDDHVVKDDYKYICTFIQSITNTCIHWQIDGHCLSLFICSLHSAYSLKSISNRLLAWKLCIIQHYLRNPFEDMTGELQEIHLYYSRNRSESENVRENGSTL